MHFTDIYFGNHLDELFVEIALYTVDRLESKKSYNWASKKNKTKVTHYNFMDIEMMRKI